jgi:hypothetical protein
MRAPDSRDIGGMARRGEPVVDGGADPAALNWRFPRTMMPGDEQDDALAAGDCPLKTLVDRLPRGVEVHAMQVEHPVRLDRTALEALVPRRIEMCAEPDPAGCRRRL